ncbi:uncharacterized protein BDZ99DRAFT_403597, partial [Mytilinidion resinicola]
KRSIIFYSMLGNRKIISIKALINALYKRPDLVLSLYIKSFKNYKGPQVSIYSIFIQAQALALYLLIFKDLDSLVQNKIRSYFLNKVNRLELNNRIFIIRSINYFNKLDPAIIKRLSWFN